MTKGLKRLQTALFFVAVLAIFAVLFTLVIGGGEGLYNSPVPVAEAAATEGVILQHGSDIGREQEGGVTEVNSLAALRSAVRANTANISITADFSWSYSSNASDFFDGSTFTHKIYGNGHTLTITGKSNTNATFDAANDRKANGSSWGAVAGVLGNGGAVYDLNVVMSGQICYSSSGAANINIGGIVGQVQSGARVENCTFALKDSASRLASVHYSSGSGIWAAAGGIAGEVSGTIANCTVNNEGWIESGLGVFSGNSMQIASDTGYGASGVVAGIAKTGADFQNIVAKGGGNVKTTYYASVLGMLFNQDMSMTVTNFWNAFSGTFHCENNGNSDNFACYLDNRGSNRVAITNYYYSDGYTAVTSDANIATSSKLLVPSGFEGQVYFDPTATDYANSLAVAYTGQREPDPGMIGTWTLIAPNQSRHTTNVLGDGGTVTFTGLPSAVATWNGGSGFSAQLQYTQQSMESMEALAPYEHGYVASETQNGTALSTATEFANVFAPNGSGNRSGNYYLTGDLYVNGFTGAEFSGTLDGNGHTLYITGLHQPTYTGPNVGGIVGKLTGTIKNLRVVLLSTQTITITNADAVNSRSLGLVAGAVTGNGKVENVSVVIPSGVTLEPDGSNAVTTALGAVAGTVGTVESNNGDSTQDNVNINNVTVQLDGALCVRGSWIYVAGFVGRGAQAQSTQYHFNNVILRGDGSLGGVTGGGNDDSSEPTYAAALIVLLKPSDDGTAQASVDGFIYDLTTDHGNGMPVTGTVSSFGYIAKNNHDTSMSANTPGAATGYVTCTNIYRTEDSFYKTFHQTDFSKGNTYIEVDADAVIANSVTGHENISLTPYFVTEGEDFGYITLAAKAEGGWGNVSMLRSEGTSAGECYAYDDGTMKFVKVAKAEAVSEEGRIGVAEVALATLQYNTQPSYNHGEPVDFGISVTRGGTPLELGVDYTVRYTGTDYDSDTAPSQTGTYSVTVTLTDGVFEGGQNAKTFAVSVQRLTLTGVGFTVEDWTYGEEGNEPVFTVTGLDDASALFKVTYSGRNGTSYSSDTLPVNAGDYTAEATLTDEAQTNYLLDGGRITAEFSIAKASISPTVTINADDWQYRWDGVQATKKISGNTGNGDVTYTYKGRGDTVYDESSDMPVNAGTYTVIAHIAETANYAAGEATADFEIIPRTVTFTVTDDSDAYKLVYGTDSSADVYNIITPAFESVEEVITNWNTTYTFKVITADGEEDYSAMTPAGSTVRITAVITATVSVGDEETGYSESADPNIIIEFKDGVDYVDRTVAKREVTLTAKGDVNETYGSTREGGFEGEFELSGALQDDSVESLFEITVSGAGGAVLPNAGVYTVTAALNETADANYVLAKGSDADLIYTVAPIAISGDWAEAASAEYDGNVHVRKFEPDGGPLPEGVLAYAYSVGEESVAEMKNAAEYTVTVSVTNGNYVFAEGVTTQSSFVIGKKTLTVALESVSGVYTGEAHVLDASSVTCQGNVEGEVPTFTVTVSPDSVVDVAEYAVTVALGEDAVNANYTIQNGDLTYSVTKAGNEWLSEFAVEGNVFGSAAQITLPTAKFGSVLIAYYTDAEHLALYEGGFTQTSPVGIYYYVLTVEGTDNYDGLEKEGSFEIAKAEVTVTGITAPEGTYDGAAYDGNIEVTYSAFAEEISAVEWQFRPADAEDGAWTPGLPTAAGEYVISVAGYTAANVTVTNTADFTATSPRRKSERR